MFYISGVPGVFTEWNCWLNTSLFRLRSEEKIGSSVELVSEFAVRPANPPAKSEDVPASPLMHMAKVLFLFRLQRDCPILVLTANILIFLRFLRGIEV